LEIEFMSDIETSPVNADETAVLDADLIDVPTSDVDVLVNAQLEPDSENVVDAAPEAALAAALAALDPGCAAAGERTLPGTLIPELRVGNVTPIAPYRVLLCTSIAASKLYVLGFLRYTVSKIVAGAGCQVDVHIVDDGGVLQPEYAPESWIVQTLTATETRGALDGGVYARVRALGRQAMLDGEYNHLYWHDADIIPPGDIVAKLLSSYHAIRCGLNNVRGQKGVCLPYSFQDGGDAAACIGGLVGLLEDEACPGNYWAKTASMACALIPRSAIEAISFRNPDEYAANYWFEDIKWFRDHAAASGPPGESHVLLDTSLSCWHVDSDGTASRVIVGEPAAGAIWTETPHLVKNRFGEWSRFTPRFDLSAEDVASLPPGFVSGVYPRTSLEIKSIDEVLAG
jgi:hypothetical protein